MFEKSDELRILGLQKLEDLSSHMEHIKNDLEHQSDKINKIENIERSIEQKISDLEDIIKTFNEINKNIRDTIHADLKGINDAEGSLSDEISKLPGKVEEKLEKYEKYQEKIVTLNNQVSVLTKGVDNLLSQGWVIGLWVAIVLASVVNLILTLVILFNGLPSKSTQGSLGKTTPTPVVQTTDTTFKGTTSTQPASTKPSASPSPKQGNSQGTKR